MSFKDRLQERIEKNSVKSEMSWTDKNGNIYTEEVIMKKSSMPLVGDWNRIYPPIDENGSINWINTIFGGRKNLIKLIIIFTIILMVFLAFREVSLAYENLKNMPCVQNCIEWAESLP